MVIAGWIAGAGFGLPLQIIDSPMSSNLTSVSINWSQRGGWSASAYGFQISKNGIVFDPSLSISHSFQLGKKEALSQEQIEEISQKIKERLAEQPDPNSAKSLSYSEMLASTGGGGADVHPDVTEAFTILITNTRAEFTLAKALIKKMYPGLKNFIIRESARNAYFTSKVAGGQVLDIKLTVFSKEEYTTGHAWFEGSLYRTDWFGNYNYGVAAKAFGFSLEWSKFGAGVSQMVTGIKGGAGPDWSNTAGYFDKSWDTQAIIDGYNRKW